MNNVFLLLGTNMGNRLKNLEKALAYIEENIGGIQKKSTIYETEPWGKANQPSYFNRALMVNTPLSPEEIMDEIDKAESAMGRLRTPENRWQQRIIDIDILFYNNLILNTDRITIPHPRLHERNFTLVPLAEISPFWMHPVFNQNMEALLSQSADKLSVTAISEGKKA